jgi:hypothetical protein
MRSAPLRKLGLAAVIMIVVMFVCWLLLPVLTSRTSSWQEDVQLSDGSVLTVDRVREFQLTGQLGEGSGWAGVQDRLSFRDASTGRTVRWQADRRDLALLDRINGRYWLVASSNDCYPDQEGQRLLQAYVLDGSDWIRVEPEQAPQITAPNLVRWPTYQRSRNWDHVSLQTQRELLNEMAEKWKQPEHLSLDLINSRRC